MDKKTHITKSFCQIDSKTKKWLTIIPIRRLDLNTDDKIDKSKPGNATEKKTDGRLTKDWQKDSQGTDETTNQATIKKI